MHSNYRLISVLPFFSKIFEKVIATRLTDYLDKHNIINENQFGFRKNCSTSMAVINMLDKVTNSLRVTTLQTLRNSLTFP